MPQVIFDEILEAVINTAKVVRRNKAVEVTRHTRLLSELDMDSLEMLEFLDLLKKESGVNLAAAGYSASDLATPEGFAAAICQLANRDQ